MAVERFVVYADGKLQWADLINAIWREFDISHYTAIISRYQHLARKATLSILISILPRIVRSAKIAEPT